MYTNIAPRVRRDSIRYPEGILEHFGRAKGASPRKTKRWKCTDFEALALPRRARFPPGGWRGFCDLPATRRPAARGLQEGTSWNKTESTPGSSIVVVLVLVLALAVGRSIAVVAAQPSLHILPALGSRAGCQSPLAFQTLEQARDATSGMRTNALVWSTFPGHAGDL